MNSLNYFTGSVFAAATIVMTAVWAAVSWPRPAGPVLDTWKLGLAALASGLVFQALNQVLPPSIAVFALHLTAVAAAGLAWSSIEAFCGRPRRLGLITAIATAQGAIATALTFGTPNGDTVAHWGVNARGMLLSLLLVGFSSLLIRRLLRQPMPPELRRASLTLVGAHALHIAYSLARVADLALQGPLPSVGGRATFQSLVFLDAIVVTVGQTYGVYALVMARRAEAERLATTSRFSGGVAHNFNNLLTVILGNLGLLRRRTAGDPAAFELIEAAVHGTKQGAVLTEQLLAFSGRQMLKPTALDLNEVLRESAAKLAPDLGPTIVVEAQVAPQPLPCSLDRGQLDAAILNLVRNAHDAMPQGGVVVLVGEHVIVNASAAPTGTDLPPGSYASFAVVDRGAGMTPDVLARAVEPFFTTKPPAAGLGLSMAYGFARQSGGALALDSTPGHGTRVRLYFPLHAESNRAHAA